MDFKKDISEVGWSGVTYDLDSEIAWTTFKDKFLDILYKHAPEKTFRQWHDTQPWVINEYLDNANERDDLQHKSKRTKNPINQFLANLVRSRTTMLKRELKRLYFQISIQNAEGNTAKLWKALKRLL